MICKICLEEASDARVTVCGHIFCEACIFQWIRSNSGVNNPTPIFNCPVCRKSLDKSKDIIVVYQDLKQPEGERRTKKETERERLVDGDGAGVPEFLQRIAKQWSVLETENKVLRLKVSDLESEVSFLKGLKQGVGDQRGATGVSDSKVAGENAAANTKENHDPRVDTAATKVMKELKKPAKIYKRHKGPVHGISISSSGALVASASWDGTCQVYDLNSNRTLQTLQHENGLYAVDFAPKMEMFLATASSETCVLWSAESGRRLRRLDEHKDEINGLRFAPKGRHLATASADCTCREWDVETGTSIHLFRGHQSEVYGVSYCPDKPLIATASFDKTCKVWDYKSSGASEKAVRTLEGHKDSVIGCHIHPDGNLIATGSDDKTCRLWDIRNWQCLAVLHHHEGDVKRVKFSNGGAFLATTSGDKSVRIYSIASLHCVRILNAHSDHVFDVAWSPKDDFIVSASHDLTWNLWEPNI